MSSKLRLSVAIVMAIMLPAALAFGRPIDKSRLFEIDLKFEGIVRGGGIAGFHGGDFAMDAIERQDGLREVAPLRFGGAMERQAEDEFRVATHLVTRRGCEFPEIANGALDIDVLR